jgi:protein TonB
MTATSDSPNFPVPARLILAIVLSVSVHSLLLIGWGRYHAGVGVRFFPHESAAPGALRVRILNLTSGEVSTPGSAPSQPPARQAQAVLSTPAKAGSKFVLPAPSSPDKAVAHESPLTRESYYRSGDLDVKPQIKVRVVPAYPDIAILKNLSGKVVIRVFIGETGNVDEVEVVKAIPPDIFDDSAITAFRAARFTPGMKGHKAVKSLVTLEVSYGSPEAQDAATGAR